MRHAPLLVLTLLLAGCGGEPGAETAAYQVAINGGRVMDPASGTDRALNLAVDGGKVVAWSDEPIEAAEVIDATGLVVAPGFIDLHQHGQSPENYRAQLRDGITTSLELEIGVENIAEWYGARSGSPVNYGASISHLYSRQKVLLGESKGLSGEGMESKLTPEQTDEVAGLIETGLAEGAAAVGFGIAYTPGLTADELERMFQLAADAGAVCHVHMRGGRDLKNLEEVYQAAKATGASAHIVHLNSSARDEYAKYLARIAEIQDEGVDITTECYPYNRGSTMIEAALFNDWETYPDEEFSQYIWVETGETLTRETFGKYREQGGTIISPPAYSEESVRALVEHPLTMIASDGMWLDKGRAHPRSFGTFSRVLGRFVRENGTLSLMDALGKMTYRPADRVAGRVPLMAAKGRLSEGSDADITIFNPETVIDRGTFSDPAQAPVGIEYVLVNGVVTLREGEIVTGAAAGIAVRAPQR